MTPTFRYIDVGSVSSLSVRVPVVTLGSGSPILTCLCGVHGDETTSLAAAHRLVEGMSQRTDLGGTIRIVTAANPIAQAMRSRVGPLDLLDLNRCGRGSAEGSITNRLAHVLGTLLAESNFVIDLHEFEMETPTMAIFIPSGEAVRDRLVLSHIAAFGPEMVWSMDVAKPDQARYGGSLLSAAISAGIPSFAVETSHALTASDSVIDAVADGLLRVAQRQGILPGTPPRSRPVAYRRREQNASRAGLWVPAKRPLERVDAGGRVGRIVALDLVTATDVEAPVESVVIQVARRTVVGTGMTVFALGTVDEATTAVIADPTI